MITCATARHSSYRYCCSLAAVTPVTVGPESLATSCNTKEYAVYNQQMQRQDIGDAVLPKAWTVATRVKLPSSLELLGCAKTRQFWCGLKAI